MSLPVLDIAAEALHEDHVPLVAEALVQVNHREEESSFRKSMCTLLPDSGQTTKLANDNQKSLTKQAQQQALEMNFMTSLMEGHPLRCEYQKRLESLHKKQSTRSKKQIAAKQKEYDGDASESPGRGRNAREPKEACGDVCMLGQFGREKQAGLCKGGKD